MSVRPSALKSSEMVHMASLDPPDRLALAG